jgi:hypothetical protein
MMETVRFSETSVNPYQTTQRHIPGFSTLQQGFVLADDDPSIFMNANGLHRSLTSDLVQTLHLLITSTLIYRDSHHWMVKCGPDFV